MNYRNNLTTLCYLEQNDCYLMLHRTKKVNDINEDKWIGIGGHLEDGESPDECIEREMAEECGIKPLNKKLRGVITFVSDKFGSEYIFLYSADNYEGSLTKDCPEGDLEWVAKSKVMNLPIWEGDKIFFRLLKERQDVFSLKLHYIHDHLVEARVDGKTVV